MVFAMKIIPLTVYIQPTLTIVLRTLTANPTTVAHCLGYALQISMKIALPIGIAQLAAVVKMANAIQPVIMKVAHYLVEGNIVLLIIDATATFVLKANAIHILELNAKYTRTAYREFALIKYASKNHQILLNLDIAAPLIQIANLCIALTIFAKLVIMIIAQTINHAVQGVATQELYVSPLQCATISFLDSRVKQITNAPVLIAQMTTVMEQKGWLALPIIIAKKGSAVEIIIA